MFLTRNTARKVIDLVREDVEQPKFPTPIPRERADNYLQITSTTQTSGRYPATLYRYNNDNTFTAISASGAVWLRSANNSTLSTGIYYYATGRALHPTTDVVLYVTDDACCTAPTPVQTQALTANANITPTSNAIQITENADGYIATLVDVPGVASGYTYPITFTNSDPTNYVYLDDANTSNLITDMYLAPGASVQAIYDGTTGLYQILTSPSSSSGNDFNATLLTDFTVTNGTLQDVTGFSFAVNANEVWEIEVHGSSSASDATGDIAVAMATTGTWTLSAAWFSCTAYGPTGTLLNQTPLAVASTTISTTSPGFNINNGDGVVRPFQFRFMCTVSGSGNIKFQMGQTTAAPARTSTLKAKTYMTARRIT